MQINRGPKERLQPRRFTCSAAAALASNAWICSCGAPGAESGGPVPGLGYGMGGLGMRLKDKSALSVLQEYINQAWQ
jgi:hypothetical protein